MIRAALFLLAMSGVAAANAPVNSIIPPMRPSTATPAVATAIVLRSLLPVPRPSAVAARPLRSPSVSVSVSVATSMRPPVARPTKFAKVIRTTATTAPPPPPKITSAYGKICGDRTIRGQTMSPIRGKLAGCGIAKPVKVYEVNGVRLTTPATMNCAAAAALKTWVKDAVQPTIGRRGGGVESLRVVAHYSCRTRNNQPGAKISEHGRGNAIDIAAINLKDGSAITILTDWRSTRNGKILKTLHAKACGPFGTVLGPNADRYHQDHFHFDIARHRGGPYCR